MVTKSPLISSAGFIIILLLDQVFHINLDLLVVHIVIVLNVDSQVDLTHHILLKTTAVNMS